MDNDDIFTPIILGMLTWVIFTLYKLQSKPPMLISCNCFKDLSHDEMVEVKKMYCEMKQQHQESHVKDEVKEEEDGVEVTKED